MHVLILNQTFYPDVAATAQHMWDLARHLDQHGHTVTAITSQSIYGSTEKFQHAHEKIGRITIHRVPQTALGKKKNIFRMVDFLSFYVSAWRQLNKVPAPDAILALTSPPMISVLALLQKRLRRTLSGHHIALVHHLMDLYPDAAVAMKVLKPKSLVTWLFGRMTRATLRGCDGIIVLGQDMKELVERNHNIAPGDPRVEVIHPWATKEELWPIEPAQNPLREKLGLNDTFNLVYSGNLGAAHDLDTMIGAIEKTKDDVSLRWVFIGGGKRLDQLKKRSESTGWKHIQFLPYQDREVLNQSLNLADVHLISQLPEFTGIVVPSKLFGILAVGKPSIMIGPADAEVSRILSQHDAGIVVPVGAVDQLVDAVRKLRDDAALRQQMGQRARDIFLERYDAEIACRRITNMLAAHVRRT